jgi:hypothetical protein
MVEAFCEGTALNLFSHAELKLGYWPVWMGFLQAFVAIAISFLMTRTSKTGITLTLFPW